MKDNFLLKKEQREIFKSLSNEDAGILIKGIFDYVCDGEDNLDGLFKIIFIPIKKEIDKNEEKYKKICERNKKNGANGGRPKNETQENPMGYFGKNTHISYIINHINHNSLKFVLNNKYKLYKTKLNYLDNKLIIIKQIIEYLNNKTESNYKYTSKITQSKIIARLNEGYKLDDFIAVINKKYIEWKNTEFEKYLCPETLFGTKFEKYLNQKNQKLNKAITKPEWIDKKIESRMATREEQEEIDKMLKELVNE